MRNLRKFRKFRKFRNRASISAGIFKAEIARGRFESGKPRRCGPTKCDLLLIKIRCEKPEILLAPIVLYKRGLFVRARFGSVCTQIMVYRAV